MALYKRYGEAAIHVEDRGFQFADAVYEVIEVAGGRLVDATRHLRASTARCANSRYRQPMAEGALLQVVGEVIRRNRVRDGIVYMQVTRGAGPREFAFPSPTLCRRSSTSRAVRDPAACRRLAEAGIAVKTMPDKRWERCDIKTVMLLPAALAKDAARRAGAREAWFVDAPGHMTEGASAMPGL